MSKITKTTTKIAGKLKLNALIHLNAVIALIIFPENVINKQLCQNIEICL